MRKRRPAPTNPLHTHTPTRTDRRLLTTKLCLFTIKNYNYLQLYTIPNPQPVLTLKLNSCGSD